MKELSLMRFIMIIFLMLTSVAIQAQVGIVETYVSDDGSFQFDYAPNMHINVVERQSTLNIGQFYLEADPPIWVDVSIPTPAANFHNIGLGNTPAAIVASRMALWRQTAPIRLATILQTDLTLAITPANIAIHHIQIDNKPAAFASFEYVLDENQVASVFMMVVDVGYDHLVTITASPTIINGSTLLTTYENEIIHLAETITFNPANAAQSAESVILPSAYTGEIGQLQVGHLTFAYPKEWYILSVGSNVFLTNTSQFVTGTLPTGTIQVNIIPPDFNMTAFVDRDTIANCALTPIQKNEITPSTVLQHHLLRDEQIDAMAQQGTTFTEPTVVQVNNREVAYMQLFTSERDVLAIAVNMGDGNVVSMMTFSPVGEMQSYINTLLAIAGSFDYQFNAC